MMSAHRFVVGGRFAERSRARGRLLSSINHND
jgi:hypothetical protein